MAFVCRSERDAKLSLHCTPDTIGPGSYGDAIPHRVPHAQAPFGSTSKRSGLPVGSRTPGPGSYAEDLDFQISRTGAKAAASSSVFRSSTRRLSARHGDEIPGPGSYDTNVNWIRENTSSKRSSSGQSPHHAGGNVSWVRVATAPSIPVRDQSYGYDEGPSGELVMQPPPESGFSGCNGNTAGPGQYQSRDNFTKKSAVATDFAHRSGRKPIKISDSPAPGQYNPSIDILQNISVKIHPSTAFSSKVHRSLVSKSDDLPAPGQYEIPSGFRSAYVPQPFQNFGSNVPRDALLRNSCAPGPGKYDLPPAIGGNTHTRAARSGKTNSSFASSSERFQSPEKQASSHFPGPGAYSEGIDNFFRKRGSQGRFGVFGTTSPRFVPEREDMLEMPAPGSYDPPVKIDPLSKRRGDPRSAVFASTTERDPSGSKRRRRKEAVSVPPPGAYDIPSSFDAVTRSNPPWKHDSFGSSSERFTKHNRSDLEPAPGSYYPERVLSLESRVRKVSETNRLQSFGSTAPRSSPTASSKSSGVLGPGAYDIRTSFDKKTYNVTFDA